MDSSVHQAIEWLPWQGCGDVLRGYCLRSRPSPSKPFLFSSPPPPPPYAFSLPAAPATLYGFGPARPCASEQGSACMLAVLQPTHPFLWFGVGLYFVGATLMGLALYLRHRMRS